MLGREIPLKVYGNLTVPTAEASLPSCNQNIKEDIPTTLEVFFALSKNNLRGITLGVKPMCGIYSHLGNLLAT